MTVGTEKGRADWEYAIAAYRYLLECWLASYGKLCCVKRTSKSELDRHEAIIRGSFEALARDMALVGASGRVFKADWKYCGRVDEILADMAKGSSALEATQRYFNRLRYGVGQNEDAKAGPKDNQ